MNPPFTGAAAVARPSLSKLVRDALQQQARCWGSRRQALCSKLKATRAWETTMSSRRWATGSWSNARGSKQKAMESLGKERSSNEQQDKSSRHDAEFAFEANIVPNLLAGQRAVLVQAFMDEQNMSQRVTLLGKHALYMPDGHH